MANPKEVTKKRGDSSDDGSKYQSSQSEGIQSTPIEELKKQAAAYEALKKQVAYYEQQHKKAENPPEDLKTQSMYFNPGEIPYSSQLNTLREKMDMLASNPNSDINEVAQCISAITYYENLQSKKIAEMRRSTNGTTALKYDNQSILQTSSVRKKEPRAIDTSFREPEFQKINQQ
jgi:hypothetical protein